MTTTLDTTDRTLIAEALRAARANGWRPRYPQARCWRQWTWTSATQPPGLPPTGATHVTLDGDWVHVKQFSDAQGWISGASVKATSARQAVDVLVAMGILPVELSSTGRHLTAELAAMTDLHDAKHLDWRAADNARERLLVERSNLRADLQLAQAEVERLRKANANLIRNAEILADEIVSGTRPVVS